MEGTTKKTNWQKLYMEAGSQCAELAEQILSSRAKVAELSELHRNSRNSVELQASRIKVLEDELRDLTEKLFRAERSQQEMTTRNAHLEKEVPFKDGIIEGQNRMIETLKSMLAGPK